ncbi:MAG: Crp/Fnr family transcriptional regulator [Pseudomonadota bacterium]
MSTNGNNTNGNDRDPRLLEGVLTSLPLFGQVARAQVAMVASRSRTVYARRGAVVCRRGERMPGVIALGYGILKLALRRPGSEEKIVRFLGPNDIFGESAAMLGRPCPVDAIALEESMIVIVPAAPLIHLIEIDPKFARNLVFGLADRFLGLLSELEATVQHSSLQRLASYVNSLATPGDVKDAMVVRLPASKTAVAARLGMTKETMSRALRELSNQRLISVSGREILIVDRRRLAQVAG